MPSLHACVNFVALNRKYMQREVAKTQDNLLYWQEANRHQYVPADGLRHCVTVQLRHVIRILARQSFYMEIRLL